MTNEEFNVEFDVYFNNISSNQAPGLNPYEKSVFLTRAQEEILKNHFNPKGNKYIEGFDDSAKRQIDFSNITKIATLEIASSGVKIDPRSKLYIAPNDLLFSLNEVILDSANHIKYNVIPISYNEYIRLTSKPFTWPLKSQAWRLLNNSSSNNIFEIIVKSNSSSLSYNIRYIRKPNPIILEDLTSYNGLSIDGKTTASSCELDSVLHREILQRAVELAHMSWSGMTEVTLQAGQRSE